METRLRILLGIYGIVILAMMACKKEESANKNKQESRLSVVTAAAGERTK